MPPSSTSLSPRPFLSFALLGFFLSAGLHGLSLRGIAPPFALVIPLHVGVFVVWIPAILLLMPQLKPPPQDEAPHEAQRGFWSIALGASPRWMRWALVALTAYAVVNLGLVLVPQLTAPPNSTALRPLSFDSAEILRLFSANWMLFYAVGYAVLDAYLRSDDKRVG